MLYFLNFEVFKFLFVQYYENIVYMNKFYMLTNQTLIATESLVNILILILILKLVLKKKKKNFILIGNFKWHTKFFSRNEKV